MQSLFTDFARDSGARFRPSLGRRDVFSFINNNGKSFLIPHEEVVAFIESWATCRDAAESALGAHRSGDIYRYDEASFREAARVVIQESGRAIEMQGIQGIYGSQTPGFYEIIDLLVRATIGHQAPRETIALQERPVRTFLGSNHTLDLDSLPSLFNGFARDSGARFRPSLGRRDVFSFINNNGKSFLIPHEEVVAFIESWATCRDAAESALGAHRSGDIYRYDEASFREAARAVIQESGRAIEMQGIQGIYGSQTPGFYEIIDLLVRATIGHQAPRETIALQERPVRTFLSGRGGPVALEPTLDPQDGNKYPQNDQAAPRMVRDARGESWLIAHGSEEPGGIDLTVVEAALENDSSSLGRVWRARRTLGGQLEAIRDQVAPDQTVGFVRRIAGVLDLICAGLWDGVGGHEREAGLSVQRFVSRNRAVLPTATAAALLELASTALSRADAAAAARDSGRTRQRRPELGPPGIYVYALPHYLRHPVAPSADDVDADRTLMKVGMSDRDTIRRFRQQLRSTELPEDPELLRIYVGEHLEYSSVESSMHGLLRAADHRQARGTATGTEWFLTSLKFLDAIAQSFGLRIHDLESS